MGFLDDVKETLNQRKQATENGALGFSTTGHVLLDMNFAVASYRSKSDQEIASDFTRAYFENPLMAVAWVFYVRDIRGGLGERRLFKLCMAKLADINPKLFIELLPLVSEYGRWDDLFSWMNTDSDINSIEKVILDLVEEQVDKDITGMENGQPISLLAKWIPTENCSNANRKAIAKKIIKWLGLKPSEYRRMVSDLRKYLDVVEVKTSANQWDQINYNTVPSYANLKYKNAFLKHDEERRKEYLDSLARGDKNVKINSSVLYPHDIVHKYYSSSRYCIEDYDEAIEQLWKNLPNLVQGGNTLVVADGSGSMSCEIGNTGITAIQVANALAIYFSEHNSGEFANKYITFSSRPQLVDFSNAKSLRDKLEIALEYDEYSNTNIEATFDLILNTAINNNYSQSDMPENIVIISDMEFDSATCSDYWYGIKNTPTKALFEEINDRYVEHGYKMPKLIFWNVNSRTNTIPIQQNELGVILISGFSVNLCNMVFSNETDPYVALVNEITKERYHSVLEITHRVLNSK